MAARDFTTTYFYNLHRLTTSLDTIFDQTLRLHSGLGLPYFVLLSSIDHLQPASHNQIANFLDITPGGVSRQVDVALEQGWVKAYPDKTDQRRMLLELTPAGEKALDTGYRCLEKIRPVILNDMDASTNLMDHIKMMQKNIDSIRHQ